MAGLAFCFLTLTLLAVSVPAVRMKSGGSLRYFPEFSSDDSESSEWENYYAQSSAPPMRMVSKKYISQSSVPSYRMSNSDSSNVNKIKRSQQLKPIFDCAKKCSKSFVKGFGDFVSNQTELFIKQYTDGNIFDKNYFYEKARIADFQVFKKFDVNEDMADFENQLSRAQIVKCHNFQEKFYKNEAEVNKYFFDNQFEFFNCVKENYKN